MRKLTMALGLTTALLIPSTAAVTQVSADAVNSAKTETTQAKAWPEGVGHYERAVSYGSWGRPTVKFTWGWVTGTVYFTRAETRSMKTVTYAAIIAGAICTFTASHTFGAGCLVSGAMISQWNYVAGNAYADGKCIKIKLPYMWAYSYSGGYCT